MRKLRYLIALPTGDACRVELAVIGQNDGARDVAAATFLVTGKGRSGRYCPLSTIRLILY